MSVGEIKYDDLMHNDKVTAYYKVGYTLLVLFAVAMVILATNLPIGMNNIDFLCLCLYIYLSIYY